MFDIPRWQVILLVLVAALGLGALAWWSFWPERQLFREIVKSAGRPVAFIVIGLLLLLYVLFSPGLSPFD